MKVRVRAPIGPIAVGFATAVAGVTTLFVIDSVSAYIAVTTLGMSVAFVWAVMSGLRARRLVDQESQPGTPKPWVEIAWPRWALRIARGYLWALSLSTVVLFLLLVAATVEIATK